MQPAVSRAREFIDPSNSIFTKIIIIYEWGFVKHKIIKFYVVPDNEFHKKNNYLVKIM
jgi:hypothetical protein